MSGKNLHIVKKQDNSTFTTLGGRFLGSNESDFLQIYNKKVTIRGNLEIRDLEVAKDAAVFINEERFETNFKDTYWLRKAYQVI